MAIMNMIMISNVLGNGLKNIDEHLVKHALIIVWGYVSWYIRVKLHVQGKVADGASSSDSEDG